MQLPTINQYVSSVADPAGLTRTLGEFTAERDNYGEVVVRSGNNACVFRIEAGGNDLLLKCYIRPRSDLAELYRYLSAMSDPLLPPTRFLPGELFVFDLFGEGRHYDVVCAEWIDGVSLDTGIARACREGNLARLEVLSGGFDRLACELLSREWAHGDLKPENIIVDDTGCMRLIDLDALYFPGNLRRAASEVGTPGYQHPARDETLYDKTIDDYSLAIISCSLKALALDPGLYGRYNRSDALLMQPEEILAGTSAAYREICGLLARSGAFDHYSLMRLLRSPAPSIGGLDAIFARINSPGRPHDELKVYTEGGLFGFADPSGTKYTDAVFEEATPFREGFSLVSIAGAKMVIDRSLRRCFPDLDTEDIKPVSEGCAAVKVDGSWGFISTDGKFVVEPVYEAASNMHCGRASVRFGGKWGFIGPAGQPFTAIEFDRVTNFREGTARAYRGGEVVYLDTEGNIIGRNKE